jgi:hypothetical protein
MFPLCSKYGDVVGKKQALVELAEARSGLAFLSWIMVYPAGGAHVCGLPSPHPITHDDAARIVYLGVSHSSQSVRASAGSRPQSAHGRRGEGRGWS